MKNGPTLQTEITRLSEELHDAGKALNGAVLLALCIAPVVFLVGVAIGRALA